MPRKQNERLLLSVIEAKPLLNTWQSLVVDAWSDFPRYSILKSHDNMRLIQFLGMPIAKISLQQVSTECMCSRSSSFTEGLVLKFLFEMGPYRRVVHLTLGFFSS